jgi:hypothetical protein
MGDIKVIMHQKTKQNKEWSKRNTCLSSYPETEITATVPSLYINLRSTETSDKPYEDE